ncbi:uncharacterized protein Dwil_GK26864 [Drosophila willistoni]|uniref:C-type lectin domain-containing protein n=1 Tax=Drosophila willistoni TaxID=7260 RepID=A0A0Q9X3D6_DROWI|nr:uncharacterized protein Dwil_GK26864 [Drosophila willistoni]
MFRLFAPANLLVSSTKITPIVEDGINHSNISTTPFIQIGNGYYFIHVEKTKNWFDAYESCRLIGAELITFNTMEEWNNILQYFKNNEKTYVFWTSGTDLAKEGNHVWFSSGQAISLDIWASGEPNNEDGLEHCDTFLTRPSSSVSPCMNDRKCDQKLLYIYEAPQPKTASFIVW